MRIDSGSIDLQKMNLSRDVWVLILSDLTEEELERCTSVCKELNECVRHAIPRLCERQNFPLVSSFREYCLLFGRDGKKFGHLFLDPEDVIGRMARERVLETVQTNGFPGHLFEVSVALHFAKQWYQEGGADLLVEKAKKYAPASPLVPTFIAISRMGQKGNGFLNLMMYQFKDLARNSVGDDEHPYLIETKEEFEREFDESEEKAQAFFDVACRLPVGGGLLRKVTNESEAPVDVCHVLVPPQKVRRPQTFTSSGRFSLFGQDRGRT